MRGTVVSIDPAPRKGSTVCDGRALRSGDWFSRKKAGELRKLLCKLREGGPDTLICWDAPLTGPRNPELAGAVCKDFSQRRIESFFSRGATDFKAPKGISVRPYSGCSHWAITRSLLGLPRTGPYDARYERLPFHLLPGEDQKEPSRPPVVEIHPAVAAWLWCRGKAGFPNGPTKAPDPWPYKKDCALRKRMWDAILGETGATECPVPTNDDQFDAAVGYLLGVLYLRDRAEPESRPSVVLLGDRQTGSFLVPNVEGLLPKWTCFLKRMEERPRGPGVGTPP